MSGERLQLLWALTKTPIPESDGSRVAAATLIRSLAKRGHVIDLLLVIKSDEVVDLQAHRDQLGVREIYIVRRKELCSQGKPRRYLNTIKNILSVPFLPLTAAPYASYDIIHGIEEVQRKARSSGVIWDALVYEGPHIAAHSTRLGKYMRSKHDWKIIYRAQNCETQLWKRKRDALRPGFVRTVFSWQAKCMQRFEESLLKHCDAVMSVSKEDMIAFREMRFATRGTVIPIGQEFSEVAVNQPIQSDEILFVGKLDWYPNREGLKWFLEEVWPIVSSKRPELCLTIAGSGDGAWLKKFSYLPSLNFVGFVPDLAPLYRRALLCIVPVFYGSGTRVKVIEASRFGAACLSTKVGVEGTGLVPGESYIRAEGKDEWIDSLCSIGSSAAQQVGERAFLQLRGAFDAARIAQRCERLLEEICGLEGSAFNKGGAEHELKASRL